MSSPAAAPRRVRLARVALGLALGAVLAFAASYLLHSRANSASAAAARRASHGYAVRDLGPAPSLRGFTDQQGKAFDPSSLAGKVQVVSFLDPRGTRVSPVIAVNLLMALRSDLEGTGQFGSKVEFVSLNVDPQAADPATMARFMTRVVGFGKAPAPVADWPFLTAPAGLVEKVVRHGFGVPYRQLDAAALRSYAAQRKARGTYFYARAWNPLARPGQSTVVDNGTLVIVGPKGHIRARIARAYQVSSVSVEQTIAAVLAQR